MAMTAAERQRKYRQSNRYQRDMFRVGLWLQGNAHHALLNLSRHHEKTHSELIGSLLLAEQERVLGRIPLDDEARDCYWIIERTRKDNTGR